MKFIVEGKFKNGRTDRNFTKEIEAENENRARELAFQAIGSDHHISRSRIQIKSVGRLEDGK
jgi:ribosomal protein L20A (L18A)